MDKHPSRKKIEMFLADLLKGEEAVGILLHLEKCEICYQRLPERNPQEVIERLLSDEEEIESERADKQKIESSKTKQPPPKPTSAFGHLINRIKSYFQTKGPST